MAEAGSGPEKLFSEKSVVVVEDRCELKHEGNEKEKCVALTQMPEIAHLSNLIRNVPCQLIAVQAAKQQDKMSLTGQGSGRE